eukprot:6465288-Amphidinium_carterae.1
MTILNGRPSVSAILNDSFGRDALRTRNLERPLRMGCHVYPIGNDNSCQLGHIPGMTSLNVIASGSDFKHHYYES